MAIEIPENLKYTDDHDWVAVEENIMKIGLSDFAQQALGDIVFVELPDVGATLDKGSAFGVVESIKSVTDLIAPASGEVIEINEELSDQPELCNSAPYESWIVKVQLSAPEEVEELMNADAYKTHCEQSS